MNFRGIGENLYNTPFDDPLTNPFTLMFGIQMGKSPFWNTQLALGEMEGRRDAFHVPWERPDTFQVRIRRFYEQLRNPDERVGIDTRIEFPRGVY